MKSWIKPPEHCVGSDTETCAAPVSFVSWCPKHLQEAALKVATEIADTESVLSTKREQLKMMVGEQEAARLINTAMIDPPPCPWCGRCLWAGGPCCAGAAEEVRRRHQTPEYKELHRQQREADLVRKRTTRVAKRARRLERLANKRLASWDTYDQFLLDQQSWEGGIGWMSP